MSVQEAFANLMLKIALPPGVTAQEVKAAALGLALEAFDEGVAAALADGIATRYEGDRIARRRGEIERLAQGEPAAEERDG